jgi:uncharacterized protein (TIGR03083 family)
MGYVAQLSDDELNAPSLLDGWTRRHLVAHLAYNAAALSRLLDSAGTGIAKPMYESGAQRAQEIEGGAELEATALRNLLEAETSRPDLDDKWRRLPRHAWSNPVRTPQGRTVPASDTLWMRTREIWIHAVDLDNGATFDAMPAIVATTLLSDIVDGWRENGAAAVDDRSWRRRAVSARPARAAAVVVTVTRMRRSDQGRRCRRVGVAGPASQSRGQCGLAWSGKFVDDSAPAGHRQE